MARWGWRGGSCRYPVAQQGGRRQRLKPWEATGSVWEWEALHCRKNRGSQGTPPSHRSRKITARVHVLPPCAVLSTDIYTSSFNPHKNLVRSFLISFPLRRGRNPDIVMLPKPLDKCVGEVAMNPGSLVPQLGPLTTLQKRLILGNM